MYSQFHVVFLKLLRIMKMKADEDSSTNLVNPEHLLHRGPKKCLVPFFFFFFDKNHLNHAEISTGSSLTLFLHL